MFIIRFLWKWIFTRFVLTIGFYVIPYFPVKEVCLKARLAEADFTDTDMRTPKNNVTSETVSDWTRPFWFPECVLLIDTVNWR